MGDNLNPTGDAMKTTNESGPPDPFETSLRAFLETPEGKRHRIKSKILLRVLDLPASNKRTRFLDRLKAHVAVHLHQEGMTASADPTAIDWQNIDWAKVWDFVLKIVDLIMKFLPLFL